MKTTIEVTHVCTPRDLGLKPEVQIAVKSPEQRIEALRHALDFYARHTHWMSVGEDGPRLVLVAQQGEWGEGWAVAERALEADK